LADAGVHVWAAHLDRSGEEILSFERMLSPAERDRAGKFHFPRDRHRFISGRGLLRAALSAYLETAPGELQFIYGPAGKPALAGPQSSALHFNLSHSGALLVLAVTRAGPVGIDVEHVRPLSEAETIADRFFSSDESAKWKRLPPDQKTAAFFNLWTRKEACLKALGHGLSDDLIRQTEVSFAPGEAPRVLALSGNAPAAASWTLRELLPASGFAGAVAVAAKNVQFTCWQR
jgi:4'-phosphopantetheinyl transferase